MAQQQDRKGTHTPATPSPASEDTLVQAGLDPALAAALLQQNPLAVQAVAGLVDNSLIAESLGLNRDQAPDAATNQSTPSPSSDGEIAGEQETEEKDPAQERPGQGSGEHGRLDPTAADYANKQFWRYVANHAFAMGLPNASAHMHHYLDNTGAEKEVDLDAIERWVPLFRENLAKIESEVLINAFWNIADYDGSRQVHWSISSWKSGKDSYIDLADSPDWFFAMGGNSHGLEATAFFTPYVGASPAGLLEIEGRWHLEDVYDWDAGKSTEILGVEVNDETLGRLHEVGLAKEFAIWGSRPFSVAMETSDNQRQSMLQLRTRLDSEEG
ncbi:MAG: hypothetical protein VX899_26615 [Myxococcota bacterium]|nr:hypothetical protein [Myxococcota bacterium]